MVNILHDKQQFLLPAVISQITNSPLSLADVDDTFPIDLTMSSVRAAFLPSIMQGQQKRYN